MANTTQYVTKDYLDQALAEFRSDMISQMNDMFNKLIEYMDKRFDVLEKQIDKLEHSVDDLAREVHQSIERVDNHETRIITLEKFKRKQLTLKTTNPS